MGPVKTYGGYKPKRRGLPKFVKQTLETTGNAFSALHIDNLKAIRGVDCLKPKNSKVTKTTSVREVQPTFDDSLDSTFDKVFKSDKNKPSIQEACLPHDNSDRCWTCGNIPSTNMAHHVLFECKEDSYYSSPSPGTQKAVAHRVKLSAHKDTRRKKLQLPKSLEKKSLKKEKTMKKPQLEPLRGHIPPPLITDTATSKFLLSDDTSPVKSPFKTPICKASLLREKSSVFLTSTPDVFDKRPKFSIQSSPIFEQSRAKRDVQEFSMQLAEDVLSNRQEHVEDTSRVSSKLQGIINEQFKNENLKDFSNNILNDPKPVEEFCGASPLLTDVNEQREKLSVNAPITCLNESYDFIETSIVEPLHRPSGYITKRRMWRRTRRTVFNLSGDMFRSITSTFDKSAEVDTSLVDRLQVVTSRQDRSFCSGKEQTCHQHFAISFDVENDVSVQCVKLNSVAKSHTFESNMECSTNASVSGTSERVHSSIVKHSSFDQSIFELSKELKVCLTLLPVDIKKNDLASSNCSSDVDMFSESIQRSKCHLQSLKCNVSDLFKEQICISTSSEASNSIVSQLPGHMISLTGSTSNPTIDESITLSIDNALEESPISDTESTGQVALRHDESVTENSTIFNESLAIRSPNFEPLRQNSRSSDISEDTDRLFEVELKPCYVKLRRCDTRTVADVTYTSHCDMSVSEDDQAEIIVHQEELNKSNRWSRSKAIFSSDSLNTVVELPLQLLGKLDKITIRGLSKTSQSFESIIQNGKLLEQSVVKLAEIQLEDEAAKEHHEEHPSNKTSSDDLSEVLSRCGQTEPLPFISCYPESMLPKCKKIGEGAYGEVFLYDAVKQKTVIKIIPIEGDIEINAAVQKKLWEIKPEIIVAQELSALRNLKTGRNSCDIFNEVLAVRCVRGRYPQWMLDLWHAFDEEKGSENDCPDVFGDDQLFIVLELAHGGQDLESYEFTSAEQAIASITQIAFALAVGESEIQFEHRDLHWGNVLVAPTKVKTVQFTVDGEKYKVNTKGVKVSVIDFTMSRMTMPDNGENMFYDFGSDEELFAAQGDYQCDVYRLMRERTRNNWSIYEPFTNILWLHYLLDKMCSMVAYRNETTKTHQQAMSKLENMRDTVLAFPSATAFSASEFFKSTKVR